MEVSVIACRGVTGETRIYPVGKNTHVNNILDETYVPAPVSKDVVKSSVDIADRVMRAFSGVGIFCVEMFIMDNDKIMVNEVAPRPHNSGHYTIEACVTSQFENHIRAVMGLPLGDCSLIRPAVMRNILGEENANGKAYVLGYEKALEILGAKLHIYGKTMVKPRRKMGHITVTADNVQTAAKLCDEAKKSLKIVSAEVL
ncbi:MAG: ATP-grasp domain-containing protein, partial [Clostridiales bacterium]|jgi:5-(carboxyamino)imidazole ribonucleotide synthase|nr:ATP-grasp domain-containing protein [Clostridiales bacterium]